MKHDVAFSLKVFIGTNTQYNDLDFVNKNLLRKRFKEGVRNSLSFMDLDDYILIVRIYVYVTCICTYIYTTKRDRQINVNTSSMYVCMYIRKCILYRNSRWRMSKVN